MPAWSKQQFALLRHVSRSAPGGPMQSTLSASGVDGEQPAEPVTFTWEFMAEPSANPGPAVVFTVTPASPLSEKARTRSARPSSDMDIGSAVSMNHRGRSSPPDSGAAIVLQHFFNKILAKLCGFCPYKRDIWEGTKKKRKTTTEAYAHQVRSQDDRNPSHHGGARGESACLRPASAPTWRSSAARVLRLPRRRSVSVTGPTRS